MNSSTAGGTDLTVDRDRRLGDGVDHAVLYLGYVHFEPINPVARHPAHVRGNEHVYHSVGVVRSRANRYQARNTRTTRTCAGGGFTRHARSLSPGRFHCIGPALHSSPVKVHFIVLCNPISRRTYRAVSLPGPGSQT